MNLLKVNLIMTIQTATEMNNDTPETVTAETAVTPVEDAVVLLGWDGDACISVEELADAAYSFNYEFVCGIARRVPRVYVKDGEIQKTVSYLLK